MKLESIEWSYGEWGRIATAKFLNIQSEEYLETETLNAFLRGVSPEIVSLLELSKQKYITGVNFNTNEVFVRIGDQKVEIIDNYSDSAQVNVGLDDLIDISRLWLAIKVYSK
jgi:hypothetical protein